MLVGYGRVGSEVEQEQQLAALRNAGCRRIFIEDGLDARRRRPELYAALALLRGNASGVLVVWRLDRLACSLRQLVITFELLARSQISVRLLAEGIDASGPEGTNMLAVFRAIADFERSIIAERTKAGLLAARSRGKKGGRPRALSSRDVVIANALVADGTMTVAEIANRLRVSSSTLYRYLSAARNSSSTPA